MEDTEKSQKLIIQTVSGNWAEQLFSEADLGDARRTKRLVQIAGSAVSSPGQSLMSSCNGDEAMVEGLYRWLENDAIDHRAIIEAGSSASTHWLRRVSEDIIAASDTSTIEVPHALRHALGPLRHGKKGGTGKRGLLVHSTVFHSAVTGESLGLGDQEYWKRSDEEMGKKHQRRVRAYTEKESFKWEAAIERICLKFPEFTQRFIHTMDREGDIYELLTYLNNRNLRYVIRASWNRKTEMPQRGVLDAVSDAPLLGTVKVDIPQKGGRKGRDAVLEIRSQRVTLQPPCRKEALLAMSVNVVYVREQNKKDGLNWTLLTSEPTDTLEDALYVVQCYRLRWKVEEFHNTWKTGGMNVEGLRLQSESALLKAASVLAFSAVRLAQLRDEADPELLRIRTEVKILSRHGKPVDSSENSDLNDRRTVPDRPCTTVLSELEWRILWATRNKGKPLPEEIPSRIWAYRNIGYLGGWIDTKRTGRVGIKAYWKGYWKLQTMVNGYLLAQNAELF